MIRPPRCNRSAAWATTCQLHAATATAGAASAVEKDETDAKDTISKENNDDNDADDPDDGGTSDIECDAAVPNSDDFDGLTDPKDAHADSCFLSCMLWKSLSVN